MRMETQEIAPDVIKANLAGRLDIGGAQEIDLAFTVVTASGSSVIVDLSQVEFVASMGLRLLITGARTAARKGKRMVLLQPVPIVEAVLVSSGTDNVAPILRNLNEAIGALNG